MLLGIHNVENDLLSEFQTNFKPLVLDKLEKRKFNDNLDCLFMDWIPHQGNKPSKDFLQQIIILKKYIKKDVKIVIFDRYLSMKEKEYNWFKNKGVILLEPAINNRNDFIYLPQPIKIPTLDSLLRISNNNRTIDLAYKGKLKDRLRDFNKYFVGLQESSGEKYQITYSSELKKEKEEELFNIGITKNYFSWRDIRFTIAFSSARNYRIGYLDEFILTSLKNCCMVLIPEEQRYFISLSPYGMVKNVTDIKYFLNTVTNGDVRAAMVQDTFINLITRYPEFEISYAMDLLKKLFGV